MTPSPRRLRALAACSAVPLTLVAVSAVTAPPSSAAAAGGSASIDAAGVLTVVPSGPDLRVTLADRTEGSRTGVQLSITEGFSYLAVSSADCTDLFGTQSFYFCPGVTRVDYTGTSGVDEIVQYAGTVPMYVDLGGGNDMAYGGLGDDAIDAGPGRDKVTGGLGDDRISGEDGDDELVGDEGYGSVDDGDDTIDGGADDDVIAPMGGADVVRGGADVDTVTYYDDQSNQDEEADFSVTLDGLSNDGADGVGQNIGPDGDVENLVGPRGTPDSITLVGNAGPNDIEVSAGGSVRVDGGGGDDEIRSSAWQDTENVVTGGPGDDDLTAYGDTTSVDGGPGTDSIYTGSGDDYVTGGTGADSIETTDGNDVVDAFDGARDAVGCGVGADSATVDAVDVVNADPGSLCETVTRPRPTGTPTVPTSVKVPATGAVAFAVKNTSRFAVDVATVAKTGPTAIGSGKARIAAGATAKAPLKLTKAGLATLRKKGSLVVKLTFSLVGNGGTTVVTKQTRLIAPK